MKSFWNRIWLLRKISSIFALHVRTFLASFTIVFAIQWLDISYMYNIYTCINRKKMDKRWLHSKHTSTCIDLDVSCVTPQKSIQIKIKSNASIILTSSLAKGFRYTTLLIYVVYRKSLASEDVILINKYRAWCWNPCPNVCPLQPREVIV